MSSAAKTLELLSHFSTSRPEIGLSQLCRIAKKDKATTYRYLQSLEAVGFVEQNPANKHYRLGPAVLQLAQVREATVPRNEGALVELKRLADVIGETAHVAALSGSTLYSLTSCESPRHGIRAIIDISTFPLHATASGICAVAFGPEMLFDAACETFEDFTPNTATTTDALTELVRAARTTGFAFGNQSFESEIIGISAPIFDQSQHFAGTVSVASVATRVTPDLQALILSELAAASREISHNWGGTIPAQIEASWERSISQANAMEPAS